MNQETSSTAGHFDPKMLLRNSAFPHETPSLRLLETHISWVVLTGKYAYKMKKPVRLPFVDYSTLQLRKHFCEFELELNRELAPDIYLDVVGIVGPASSPSLTGPGEVIEYAVRMNEFEQSDILAHRLEKGLVTASEIDRLANLIADFHSRIPRAGKDDSFGSPARIEKDASDNFSAFISPENGGKTEQPNWDPILSDKQREQLEKLSDWTKAEFSRCGPLMEQRLASGMVRRCHGDMHSGNIVLFNGQIEVFDRIEFNPDFQWTDCMSELAFPVMDLVHHGRSNWANRLTSNYFERTGDFRGLGVFRFYLVYRSMVRAKVDWIRYQQTHRYSGRQGKAGFDTPFLELAGKMAHRKPPFLYITHGLSGSGKSTAAMKYVEEKGALRIRSDIERNRLKGVTPNGQKYSSAARSKVYDAMLETADTVLEAGFPVVVDATFLNRPDREKFESLARRAGVPFGIVNCTAPVDELERRIRERKGDASEATVAVLHQQIRNRDSLTSAEQDCLVAED